MYSVRQADMYAYRRGYISERMHIGDRDAQLCWEVAAHDAH